MMEHVKSNLIMFLKKQPVIDETAEAVLQILLSMMKLSKGERSEL